MPAESPSLRAANIRSHVSANDRAFVAASLVLQLVLGISLGHVYDMRINMATGYLVATGQNPYVPQDLVAVFHNPAFQNFTSIGYPPAWPMLLGLIYLVSYGLLPNLLVYGLAIKLPIIAANIGLAYVVRWVLDDCGADRVVSHRAWIFLLFNPFLLYFTTAWGQIDSIVAVLTLLSLVMLYQRRVVFSAVLLSLAISFKPISIPVLLVAIVFLWEKPWRRLASFVSIFMLGMIALCVLPFMLFKWDPTIIFTHWNAVFTVSGGMSLVTLYELVKNTYLLPGMWWLTGFIWLPAMLIGAFFIRFSRHSPIELIRMSLAMTLVFFLTRTWLSEPNLSLVLPMMLILASIGEIPGILLTATWVLPLIFTFFNTSPPQLLFPILPGLMEKLLLWMDSFRPARLIMRMVVVIPWQVTGWWTALRVFRKVKPV